MFNINNDNKPAVFDRTEVKPVWNYDDNGKYTEKTYLNWMDRSPISGTWQLPAKCTVIEVLEPKDGYDIYYNKQKNMWEYVEITVPEDPENKVLTLEEKKEQKILEFKNKRNQEEIALISYQGHLYDYDDLSRERIRIARDFLADNNAVSIIWTTADTPNQEVKLVIADFIGINNIAARRSNELHVKYRDLKAKVEAATNEDELNAITW